MLKTIRILMIAVMALLAVAVAIMLWARQSGVWTPGQNPANLVAQNQNSYKPGGPFTLVDHTGAQITEAAMANKPIAVFFGFTSCPEVCPTTLQDVDDWMTKADPSGQKLEGFFITVDPERDDPEIMNSYVTFFSDRITGVTGEPNEVWELVKSWGVFHEKRPYSDDPADGYDINHTASVFLVDAKGDFRGTISWGEDHSTAVSKLKNLL